MNTTTTIQEGALILINEYNEVKTALFEIQDNLRAMGKDRSILSDIVADRYHQLFKQIWNLNPTFSEDETMDWIEDAMDAINADKRWTAEEEVWEAFGE